MNKKKETEKERQEYLQERKVYIEWMRQSSQEFFFENKEGKIRFSFLILEGK